MAEMREIFDVPGNDEVTYITSSSIIRGTRQTGFSIVSLNSQGSEGKKIPGYDPILSPDSTMFASCTRDEVTLTVRDVETMKVVQRCKLKEVKFWRWLLPGTVCLVTRKSLFCWHVNEEARPVKVFDHCDSSILADILSDTCTVTACACDVKEKYWAVSYSTSNSAQEESSFTLFYSVDENYRELYEGASPIFLSVADKTFFCYIEPDDERVYVNMSASILHVIDTATVASSPVREKTLRFDISPHYINGNISNLKELKSFDMVIGAVGSSRYGLLLVLSCVGSVIVFDVVEAVCLDRMRIPDLDLQVSDIRRYGSFLQGEEEGIIGATRDGRIVAAVVSKKTLSSFLANSDMESSRKEILAQRWKLVDTSSCTKPKKKKKKKKKTTSAFDLCVEELGKDEELLSENIQPIGLLCNAPESKAQHDSLDCTREGDDFDIEEKNMMDGVVASVSQSNDPLQATHSLDLASDTSQLLECMECARAVDTTTKLFELQAGNKENVERKMTSGAEKVEKDESSIDQTISTLWRPNTFETQPEDKPTSTGLLKAEQGEAEEKSYSEENREVKEKTKTEERCEDAEKTDADDGKSCIICYEEPCNAVLVPCGHMWFCYGCAKEIQEKGEGCPACRAKICTVVKVYALT